LREKKRRESGSPKEHLPAQKEEGEKRQALSKFVTFERRGGEREGGKFFLNVGLTGTGGGGSENERGKGRKKGA